MNEVKVSVVMITYGHENFIEQAMDGVLTQECDFKIELIIANDHSPDKTEDIVNNYIDKNLKGNFSIIYINRDRNLGVLPNFIDALSQAKGQYIALCEGDDYWTDPLKLQKQVSFLDNNDDYVLSNTECDFYYQDKDFLMRNANKENRKLTLGNGDKLSQEDILDDKYIIRTASVVFKKSILKEYFESNFFINYGTKVKMGDTPLWSFMSKKGKFHYLTESTMVYRVSGIGVSNLQNTEKALGFRLSICEMRLLLIKECENCFSRKFIVKTRTFYKMLYQEAILSNFNFDILLPSELKPINTMVIKLAKSNNFIKLMLVFRYKAILKFISYL